MKHRYEDDLAMLAFGELPEVEAAPLRQIIEKDPEAARVYASYREMAGGLKLLPVPEHQLSTERLRDAILNQDLKQRSKAPFWQWLWGPIAVGAAAYLVMSFVNSGNRPLVPTSGSDKPILVDSGTPDMAQVTPPSNLHVTMPDGNSLPSAPAQGATERAHSPKRSISGPGLVAMATKRGDGRNGLAIPDRSNGKREPVVLEAEAISPDIENAVAMNAISSEPSSQDAQPLILIRSDKDTATGANRAMEVSTTNNVLVGG